LIVDLNAVAANGSLALQDIEQQTITTTQIKHTSARLDPLGDQGKIGAKRLLAHALKPRLIAI
jgi:hypothetical protein